MTDSSEVFLARQPIFDRNVRVVGYEVIFRGHEAEGASDGAIAHNAQAAAATVVINTLVELGLERLVSSHQAWINLPGEFLLGSSLWRCRPVSRFSSFLRARWQMRS